MAGRKTIRNRNFHSLLLRQLAWVIQRGWFAVPVHCTQSDETNENMPQIKNATIIGAMKNDWGHTGLNIMRSAH